jgi:RHS repeat-associated protein
VVSPLVNETFAYDPVGNRTSSHVSTTYQYESANRLLEDDQFAYAYDANGNLTDKTDRTVPTDTTHYAYDVENQLTSVTLPDARVVTYRYDGLGRRIERAMTGGVTEQFLYDQEDLVSVYTGTSCWQQSILHGPGIDQPLNFIQDTNGDCGPGDGHGFGEPLRYLTTDGLGSITSLIRYTGLWSGTLLLAEQYVYDSFGNVTVTDENGSPRTSSAYGTRYFFTGREYDFETGLYYYRARYYDPKIGRFLQEDPVSYPNLYPYADDNPINLVDPTGEAAIWAIALLAMYFVLSHPDTANAPGGEVEIQPSTTGTEDMLKEAALMAAASTFLRFCPLPASRTPKVVQQAGKRFFKGATRKGTNLQSVRIGPGRWKFSFEVPGKVPGARAVYEKVVDSSGRPISVQKFTYDPQGILVHVKDKLKGYP